MPRTQHHRPLLSREYVDSNRRERVARAVAMAAREEGIRPLTAELLTRRGRIGRKTFYELFGSRRGCIEFACEMATAVLTDPLLAVAAGAGPTRRNRAEKTVDVLLDTIGGEPVLAELCLVHSPGADVPDPHRFRKRVLDATWQALGGDRMAELAAAAIVTLLEMQLAREAVSGLPQLREGLLGLAGV